MGGGAGVAAAPALSATIRGVQMRDKTCCLSLEISESGYYLHYKDVSCLFGHYGQKMN
jgi:hypothetical protein